MSEKYLTLDEVATILGADADAVYALVRAGKLPGVKTAQLGWRVSRSVLRRYVEH